MNTTRLGLRRLSRRAALIGVVGTLVAAAPVATVTTGAQTAPSFSSPVPVGGAGASEPGISVAPNGNLFINAPDGLLSNGTSPSYVFRSTTGGASWVQTPPGMRSDFPGGGDSDLQVDPVNGDLYMIDLWLGDSTASMSTDQGNTWNALPIAGPPLQDRPWIATSGNGIVYEATHQLPSGIVVSKSLDGGLVYVTTAVAATVLDQTGCICPSGNIIAQNGGGSNGSSDKVGVIYATSTGGVNFAYSTNGGLTFTNATVAPASGNTTNANFPVVANAGSNHLVATWMSETGSASVIQFSQSSDWGATWSAPATLVSSGTSVYPWIAASGSEIAISLYNTPTASPTPDGAPASAQWYESALVSSDGGSTWSALTTADPTPAKTGPVCTAGASCSANRELGDFQSLAVDASGNLDLAYVRVPSPGSSELMFVQGT